MGRMSRLCAGRWVSFESSLHRWRGLYSGMKADDAKRLKELERENVMIDAAAC